MNGCDLYYINHVIIITYDNRNTSVDKIKPIKL